MLGALEDDAEPVIRVVGPGGHDVRRLRRLGAVERTGVADAFDDRRAEAQLLEQVLEAVEPTGADDGGAQVFGARVLDGTGRPEVPPTNLGQVGERRLGLLDRLQLGAPRPAPTGWSSRGPTSPRQPCRRSRTPRAVPAVPDRSSPLAVPAAQQLEESGLGPPPGAAATPARPGRRRPCRPACHLAVASCLPPDLRRPTVRPPCRRTPVLAIHLPTATPVRPSRDSRQRMSPRPVLARFRRGEHPGRGPTSERPAPDLVPSVASSGPVPAPTRRSPRRSAQAARATGPDRSRPCVAVASWSHLGDGLLRRGGGPVALPLGVAASTPPR